jgi:uncharacterized protein DUF4388
MSDRQQSGDIRSETVPELLERLHRGGESGRLTLKREPVTKILHLREGAVIFASSNDRDDRLIQCLLRRGTVPLPRLMKALETSLKERRRLGEALIAQKSLDQPELVRALREQIKDIVCGAFNWTSGAWRLEAGADPGTESITLDTRPEEMILEGVRRIESWARVQEIVGGLNTEYRATRDAAALADRARLIPGERQILNLCEEVRTLQEICEIVPLNDFVICKLVWGLTVVGALMKA